MIDQRWQVAGDIARHFSALPMVEAVALAGSVTTGTAEDGSDIDVYVYATEDVPLAERRAIAAAHGAKEPAIGLEFWEAGDEWIDAASAIGVDLIFRKPAWIEDHVTRVMTRWEASIGYSTCFVHNVASARALYDRTKWFASLQAQARQPYPLGLRNNIIEKNLPILRDTQFPYLEQISKAVRRHDAVCLNHRIAALLASYFDILFATNSVLHPGEKRLLTYAEKLCPLRPPEMRFDVEALLEAKPKDVEVAAHRVVDGIEALVRSNVRL